MLAQLLLWGRACIAWLRTELERRIQAGSCPQRVMPHRSDAVASVHDAGEARMF